MTTTARDHLEALHARSGAAPAAPGVPTRPVARVALVGAGPGDPELLTLRAARALSAADVVIIDALANPAVLVHCRPDVRVIDVGKRGHQPSTPQALICKIIVREAAAGHRVVRLKGGDPFVFGRGGEELLALAEHGLSAEVIPGISSALAAPARLGMPVTHRGLSRSVTVVTGTSAPLKKTGAQDPALAESWAALAKAGGTLVFLMAVRPLGRIVASLRAAGLSAQTPAAMVQRASLPDERHVLSTLGHIEQAAQSAGIGAPAVLVVGDVAGLPGQLRATLASAPVRRAS